MPEEKKGEDGIKPFHMVMMVLAKTIDSGLGPWALAAMFVLALVWLLTRNLDSKDTLAFLARIGTLGGFAWLGWPVALLEIVLFKWILDRTKRLHGWKSEANTVEIDQQREHFKKLKQSELTLNPVPERAKTQ